MDLELVPQSADHSMATLGGLSSTPLGSSDTVLLLRHLLSDASFVAHPHCVSAHVDPAEVYPCNQCHQSAHHQQTLLGLTPPHKLPVEFQSTRLNKTDCNICRVKLQCCCWLEGRAPGWAVPPPKAVTTSACPLTSHCSSSRQSASSGFNSWLQMPITAKDLPSGESHSRHSCTQSCLT